MKNRSLSSQLAWLYSVEVKWTQLHGLKKPSSKLAYGQVWRCSSRLLLWPISVWWVCRMCRHENRKRCSCRAKDGWLISHYKSLVWEKADNQKHIRRTGWMNKVFPENRVEPKKWIQSINQLLECLQANIHLLLGWELKIQHDRYNRSSEQREIYSSLPHF